MNPYLFIFIISFVPLFESRYAIVYAYMKNVPFIEAYAIIAAAVAIEAITLPYILPYLDVIILKLSDLGVPGFKKLRDYILNRARKKGEKVKESKKTYAELFLFVAIPVPGTGVYTGSLIYYVLGLDKKKTAITLLVGGLAAMTINSIITYGIIENLF